MRKPTEGQAHWLKRIAQSPLMKTYVDGVPQYSLMNGAAVPATTASVLIRNGWVERQGDALWGETRR